MKKYYISSKTGQSGICKYSKDFYELVLKEKGYIFVDSADDLTSILSKISSKDHVHIELGIFQKKEIEILFIMLDANYRNIAVTLHDAPLLKYPFHEFKNSLLNKMAKFYDIYINKFKASSVYINKIKTIYVLSEKGMEAVRSKYQVKNVHLLPHIIDEKEIKKCTLNNNNFIYLGFIGKNKGIEYSLQLHQKLLTQYPEMNFYVVGRALGKEKKFYTYLKEKYKTNVNFLGYVPEEQLDKIFEKATFSLMPFKDYRFFSPISGSILYNLKKGKILFTNDVNAISEIIEDGSNGFYLSGEIKQDMETITTIINNKHLLDDVKDEIYNYLKLNHTAEVVSKNLREE